VRNNNSPKIENFTTSKKWNRNKCPYILGTTIEDTLKKYNIQQSSSNWDLYFPCSYDNPIKEINEMPTSKNGKYFIIDNCDILVAKDWLWKTVSSFYGLEKAKTMLPDSYILHSDEDMERFDREYEFSKLYIMKKNIQRQEGLKITNNKDDIINGAREKYVIVQELLQNPYTINGRKTNMRFYVLVICKNGRTNVYIHKDGFMYYSRSKFVKNSSDPDPNITTGYIDRSVYDENPLTHEDLRNYLDKNNRNLLAAEKSIRDKNLKISDVYFQRIYDLTREIFLAFIGKICTKNKLSNNTTFQLFGMDIAVDDTLKPKVMEINKGPSLQAMDKRDSDLKQNVVKNSFQLAGIIEDDNKNGFIKVI
jgi:hypothetical protein